MYRRKRKDKRRIKKREMKVRRGEAEEGEETAMVWELKAGKYAYCIAVNRKQ
jgi:hypothetical protein